MTNASATHDNMTKRGVKILPSCNFCRERKTIEHVLLLCPWTTLIWLRTLGIHIDTVGVSKDEIENFKNNVELAWEKLGHLGWLI